MPKGQLIFLQSNKLPSNVSSTAIQDEQKLPTVHDNNPNKKTFILPWGIIFSIASNVATLDVPDRQVLDVEAKIVTLLISRMWKRKRELEAEAVLFLWKWKREKSTASAST